VDGVRRDHHHRRRGGVGAEQRGVQQRGSIFDAERSGGLGAPLTPRVQLLPVGVSAIHVVTGQLRPCISRSVKHANDDDLGLGMAVVDGIVSMEMNPEAGRQGVPSQWRCYASFWTSLTNTCIETAGNQLGHVLENDFSHSVNVLFQHLMC